LIRKDLIEFFGAETKARVFLLLALAVLTLFVFHLIAGLIVYKDPFGTIKDLYRTYLERGLF
jgi:hypothetical protein